MLSSDRGLTAKCFTISSPTILEVILYSVLLCLDVMLYVMATVNGMPPPLSLLISTPVVLNMFYVDNKAVWVSWDNAHSVTDLT